MLIDDATVERYLPLPHIPDELGDRDAAYLLSRLERRVCHFHLGPGQPTEPDENIGMISGTKHTLIPVVGIAWANGNPNIAVVYIEGQPYTFSYDWIGGQQAWIDR